jgi:hypothetical protein
MAATWGQVLKFTATRIAPAGLVVGAGMETFMYYTGFWKTALKKENERRAEAKSALARADSSGTRGGTTNATTTAEERKGSS